MLLAETKQIDLMWPFLMHYVHSSDLDQHDKPSTVEHPINLFSSGRTQLMDSLTSFLM